MSAARAAETPLKQVFLNNVVTSVATNLGVAIVGGVIQGAKKICQNSQEGYYTCSKCGMKFPGKRGADTYCPRCGKRMIV